MTESIYITFSYTKVMHGLNLQLQAEVGLVKHNNPRYRLATTNFFTQALKDIDFILDNLNVAFTAQCT